MSIYAKNTEVSVEKSRAEIESTLTRYGATAFAYATNMDKAMLRFEASGRQVVFILGLPDRTDNRFRFPLKGGKLATWLDEMPREAQHDKWERACRQKWRCLALAIKAKLESVESGIATFEEEFMSHIVLPNGQTVGQVMTPQIEAAYKTGSMPPMLPLLPHFGSGQ